MIKTRIYAIVMVVLLISSFSLRAQNQEELNILFIGNSFTARHNLSGLVKKIFEEGKPGLKVNVSDMIYGGQSLFQHTEYYYSQTFIEQNSIQNSEIEGRIAKMEDLLNLEESPEQYKHFWQDIRKGENVPDFPKNLIKIAVSRHKNLLNNNSRVKWDYVVLQSWMDEIEDSEYGYAKHVRHLAKIAKDQGAEVVLYITAPDVQNKEPVSAPVNQQNVDQKIDYALKLAGEINPHAVIHVPLAINMIQEGGTDLTFCYINDFHPNQRTAFLTANMFYAAFFNESTDGFNFNTVTETKIHSPENDPDVKLDPDDGPATVFFEGEEKIYLQQMAYNAVMKFYECWKSGNIKPAFTLNYGQENKDDTKYPYWGDYHKTPVSKIKQAIWIEKDTVIDGWDWSLPNYVEPSAKSNLCIARNSGLDKNKIEKLPEINFPCNPVISHWVKWRDLEPEEGKINFQPLIGNIKLAAEKGYGSIVRIHFSAIDFAPDWIKKYNIPIRKERKENPIKTNYDPGHPAFHKRYIKFINALGESGIPQMEEVKGLFLGYASPSNGDEGIGPHPEHEADANDTIPHVMERINAWAEACKGVEYKVFMGGLSNYGFSKGFGIRRGFVEMYLYHIPNEHIGQELDDNDYLIVDESNHVIANNLFQGEENEEYEERWATDWRDFRFGHSTVSFPYRYFTANLRLLQMRCNYLLNNEFSLLPEMLAWVSLELGRTREDTPDAWSFLRESYIKNDGGRPVKNFERWLYQRDAPGYETTPAIKIDHPIQMWMVEPGKYYDYVARKGKKMGFDVDDNLFPGKEKKMAFKVSYYDGVKGNLKLVYKNNKGLQNGSVETSGKNRVKTATFFVDAEFNKNAFPHDFDFELHSEEEVPVFFIRVVKL